MALDQENREHLAGLNFLRNQIFNLKNRRTIKNRAAFAYNIFMSLFDFLNIPSVKKTLRYGQAVGNVLRRKVENTLDENELQAAPPTASPQEAVINELLKNLKQFQAIRNSRRVIGFLAIEFFLSNTWQRHSASLLLSDPQKTVLDRAYGFLSQCNAELGGMEVRKDGFIKGQLSEPLLESGAQVLQDAIGALKKKE